MTQPGTDVRDTVKPFRIAYLRVSTTRQGESGLGLEAQRAAVAAYAKAHGCELLAEYVEVETAKRDDLSNRPELRKAIAHARRARAVLVVAKLDRLVRSVHVTSMLHQSGVDFVAVDNPNANRLTIQILAAVAEHEAKMISDRTKAALAAYKARGGLLGAQRPECRRISASGQRKGANCAGETHRANADAAYADLAEQMLEMRSSGKSLQNIANALNASGHLTRRARSWSATQVARVLDRFAQSNPRAQVA